ncbi:asparagine synthase-related protein [Streptomyces microflavus]
MSLREHCFDSIRDYRESEKQQESVEKFKDAIEIAMSNFDSRAVLLLSGGLDSTILASAWMQDAPSFSALTYRLPNELFAKEDLRRLHRLQRSGRVDWNVFQIPSRMLEADWMEDWARKCVQMLDDPPVGSPVLLSARWAICREASARGFKTVINGEGGDELFELPSFPTDMWMERAWIRAIHMFLRDDRYRSWPSYERILAQALPSFMARGRQAGGLQRVLPVAASNIFLDSDAASIALEAFRHRLHLPRFHERMMNILMSSASENARSGAEYIGEWAGVEVESPLLAPRIVEIATSLRAIERMHPSVSKPFLISALNSWGDRDVSGRAAVDTTYLKVLHAVAGSLRNVIGKHVQRVGLLSSWVDGWKIDQRIGATEATTNKDSEFILRLYFGALWMTAIEAEFNVD